MERAGIHVVLFILWLAVVPWVARGECPSACSCVNQEVDCTSAGLDSIPGVLDEGITKLILADNNIAAIDEDAFSRYTLLDNLDLQRNQIQFISETALSGLTSLKWLHLGENQIDDIYLGAFDDLESLETLNMSNNFIMDLPSGLFLFSYNLRYLYIANNRLKTEIFTVINNRLPWLWTLDLSGNELIYIPYKAFSNMAHLHTLTMCSAHLSSIDPNAFIGLDELSFLDLTGNDMTDINRQIYQVMLALRTIGLSGNSMECTCGTQQFQDWMDEQNVVFITETYCSVNGTQYEVAYANLTWLCSDEPPDPVPVCGPESYAKAIVSNVQEAQAVLHIEIFDVQFPPSARLSLAFREFGGEEIWSEIENDVTQFPIGNLSMGMMYIVCVFEKHCFLRSCVDFETSPGEPDVKPLTDECDDIAFAIGMTSLGFTVVLIAIFVIIFMLIKMGKMCFSGRTDGANMYKSENSNPDMVYAESARHIGDISASPSVKSKSDDLYEAIPAEVLDTDQKDSYENRAYKFNIQRQSLPKVPDENGNTGKDKDHKVKAAQSPKGKKKSPIAKRKSPLPNSDLLSGKVITFSRPKPLVNTAPGNIPDLPEKKTVPHSRSSDSLNEISRQRSEKMVKEYHKRPKSVEYMQETYLEPMDPTAFQMTTIDPSTRWRQKAQDTPPGAPHSPHLYNEPDDSLMYENDKSKC